VVLCTAEYSSKSLISSSAENLGAGKRRRGRRRGELQFAFPCREFNE